MISPRRSVALLGLIALVAVARVAATWTVYTNTFDEPVHIIMGMEWLDRGTYSLEMQHPPLARIAEALGPFLAGIRYPPVPVDLARANAWENGLRMLYGNGYRRTLTLARLGTIPFLILALVITWAWGRRLHGEAGGLLAALLVSSVPPILAHAGLATTDCAAMATTLAALYCLMRWIEEPTAWSAAFVALSVAGAITTKFSALLFLPVGAIVLAATHAPSLRKRHLMQVVPVLAGIGVLSWAVYRFSVWPVRFYGWPPTRSVPYLFSSDGWFESLSRRLLAKPGMPAPQLLAGLESLVSHEVRGHPSYLFGSIVTGGRWYFFPMDLAIKTPLALVLLAIAGSVVALRSRVPAFLAPMLIAMAVIVATMPVHINIGVRHVLLVYPLIAITAAGGALTAWKEARGKALVIAAVTWLLIAGIVVHPDYLPYGNELVGGHAERAVVDSDFDWGQDLDRLNQLVGEGHIDRLAIAYFGSAQPALHLRTAIATLPPHHPVRGWVAISETEYEGVYRDGRAAFGWLRSYEPVARAGKSIRLYFIPPAASGGRP